VAFAQKEMRRIGNQLERSFFKTEEIFVHLRRPFWTLSVFFYNFMFYKNRARIPRGLPRGSPRGKNAIFDEWRIRKSRQHVKHTSGKEVAFIEFAPGSSMKIQVANQI
jgi:hypothetical protein